MPRKASKPTKRAPKVALSHLDESEVSESEADSVSDYQASSNSEDERCSTPESQKDSKCGVCRRTVNSSDKSLQCDTCSEWCHIKVPRVSLPSSPMVAWSVCLSLGWFAGRLPNQTGGSLSPPVGLAFLVDLQPAGCKACCVSESRSAIPSATVMF